jgi:hypothetical protein
MSDMSDREIIVEALERLLKMLENLQRQVVVLAARQDVSERMIAMQLDELRSRLSAKS